jgi:D-glycero-beta-D-manno-heptose-7-phosphate kinase
MSNQLLSSALDKIANSPKPKITVIGDLILDEYLIGYPERISREAPVLILEHKESYFRLGGASNAAINAAHLGAEVTLIGSVGLDGAADELSRICLNNNINLQVLQTKDKPTTLKTRILSTNQGSSLSHSGTSHSQQILRIDKQNKSPISPEDETALLKIIERASAKADCVLLSDYVLGLLTDKVIQEIMKNFQNVVVDPSSSFSRFRGAKLLTPNEPDTEKELNDSLDFSSVEAICKSRLKLDKLLQKQNSNLLVTRGAEGMVLFEESWAHFVPAFNKAEVFDVTGAGDTVSACICFGLANHLSLLDSVLIGNLAASIVVRKSGSATTTLAEMKLALENLAPFSVNSLNLE